MEDTTHFESVILILIAIIFGLLFLTSHSSLEYSGASKVQHP